MLKKLDLTAAEMLRQEAVRDRVTRPVRKQQAGVVRLYSTARYYWKLRIRGHIQNKDGSSASECKEESPTKPEKV